MNTFVANILRSKPAEIYLRGINKQYDKTKELILKKCRKSEGGKPDETYLRETNKLPDKTEEVIQNDDRHISH